MATVKPGKFVWYELVSKEARKAQAFYAEVFGWTTKPFNLGGTTYDMIYAGDAMIGSYAEPNGNQPPHWISYVSVGDVDAAAKIAVDSGGKIVDGPVDTPEIGRMARIADPQGAELYLFRGKGDDQPDGPAPHGHWLWNELHTADPEKALAFYAKVVGFTHRTMGTGPDTYHIISGGGADRGGVTAHLDGGMPPHWLPYVSVDDADAALDRARKAGGIVAIGPADIPNTGRFGVIRDPVGAVIALLRPQPM
jgi:predicted enzyme related to lactoylglutathione lyase